MVIFDVVAISLITLAVYLGLKVWNYVYAVIRLPPGPIGIPFLGVVSEFADGKVVQTIQKWKDVYGDIYSFTLPGQSIVVISSYDLIKDVLLTRSDVFSGRPDNFKFQSLVRNQPVVGFNSESPRIRMLKKTMSTSIKMYGERLLKLEDISLQALKELIDYWKSFDGEPLSPEESLQDLTRKIITSLTFGRLMTENQVEQMRILDKEVGDFLRPGGEGQILEFLPWVRFFGLPLWKKIMTTRKSSEALFKQLIEESLALYDGKNPECFLHSHDLYQKNLRQEYQREILTDSDILNNCRGLIGAGTNTTYTATMCFVAIMTNHPEIQGRLQREVDGAVGSKTPRLEDKERMPYVEATLYELLRYTSHAPLLVPHLTMEKTTLGVYTIPKGTQVWVNAFGLHHDPRYWDEPSEFKPERYLDEEGKLVTPDHMNRRRMVSFGAGRRSCPGEVLAKNRLFLFMANLVQNFTFKPKSKLEKPKHDPLTYVHGLACRPQDYEVCAIQRKN